MLNLIATVIRFCDQIGFGVIHAKGVVWNFIVLAPVTELPNLEPMFLHKSHHLWSLYQK